MTTAATGPLVTAARQLDSLIDEMDDAALVHADEVAAVSGLHRRGALNLIHFTAMRSLDLRSLQDDLTNMGVTSLATTGTAVRAKVLAAREVVGSLAGERPIDDLGALRRATIDGETSLEVNCRNLLGALREERSTRIMVTLPSEAADDPNLIPDLVRAGMDVARINCAHDDPAAWERMATRVRAAGTAAGRPVLISMDLPGPKLRTGPIADGPCIGRARVTRSTSGVVSVPASIRLVRHDIPVVARPPTADSRRPTLDVAVDPAWLASLRHDDQIDLVDARGLRRRLTVSAVTTDDVTATCEQNVYIANGTTLSVRQSSSTASGIAPLVQRLLLVSGDRLVLTSDLTPVQLPEPGAIARIGCTLPEAIAALKPGDAVLFDDGAIVAEVETVRVGEVTVIVRRTRPGGRRLGAEKGINLPDTDLPLPALTPEDEAHLALVTGLADMVAVSFVRSTADVAHVLDRLVAAKADELGLILKIETRQGFENLPAILLVTMQHPNVGVMVARGDLAVEIGFERMAKVPRQILALCEAALIPSIWATQVLESLAKTGEPSRAEITDAAAGERADCVMLNKGPSIVAAIEVLDRVLMRTAQVQHKSRTLLPRVDSWDTN